MLQKYYDRSLDFLKQVEEEYSFFLQSNDEWELLHLKFLLYYLIRFRIKNENDFLLCHFRAAYRSLPQLSTWSEFELFILNSFSFIFLRTILIN